MPSLISVAKLNSTADMSSSTDNVSAVSTTVDLGASTSVASTSGECTTVCTHVHMVASTRCMQLAHKADEEVPIDNICTRAASALLARGFDTKAWETSARARMTLVDRSTEVAASLQLAHVLLFVIDNVDALGGSYEMMQVGYAIVAGLPVMCVDCVTSTTSARQFVRAHASLVQANPLLFSALAEGRMHVFSTVDAAIEHLSLFQTA
jgi:hypothetical protein